MEAVLSWSSCIGHKHCIVLEGLPLGGIKYRVYYKIATTNKNIK